MKTYTKVRSYIYSLYSICWIWASRVELETHPKGPLMMAVGVQFPSGGETAPSIQREEMIMIRQKDLRKFFQEKKK